MYEIDKEKRQVKIGDVTLNEFDVLYRKFLYGTEEKYECFLKLLDIELVDEDGEKTGEKETKAFSCRAGYDNWVIEFIPYEYIIEGQSE
jgi:hypothetical protein